MTYLCRGMADALKALFRVEQPSWVKIIYNLVSAVDNNSQYNSVSGKRRGPTNTYRDFFIRVQIRR